MPKILAIIPARGGSKRVPGKNLREVSGRSLIAHAVLAAKSCVEVDSVVVSTDDASIRTEAEKYGARVDMRPAQLATDAASTIDVILELLEREDSYEFVLVLQPTSPLRTSDDINAAVSIQKDKDADAVISVTRTDPPPQWSGQIGDDLDISGFLQDSALVRSQDLDHYYHLNGAIYLSRVERLRNEKRFLFSSATFAYMMPRYRSVDIDEEIDFAIAEALSSYCRT